MESCKTHLVRLCLILLATVPAYCQRGTIGIDVGQSSDKFGALASQNGPTFDVNGEVTIMKPKPKEGGATIVAGGEARFPSDTNNHAKEYSLYGGMLFQAHNFTFGADAQVHKLILPSSVVDNQFFARSTLEFLEIPLVVRYNFGQAKRIFFEAKGAPEFHPRFHPPSGYLLPNPNLDHGYFVRGTLGYNFAKLYFARVSYETRYLKFDPGSGNPNGLYNWRTNVISGGVGINF